MTTRDDVPLAHVSDTARWVAMYRALETERPDALFRDPFARRLAGKAGERMLRTIPKARRFAWPMIVRTALIDEIVLRTVTRDGADLVLNLAAGLDARPWRLDLPPGLRWFDVDLPGVVDHKLEQMAQERPACRLESVRVDLANVAARRALLASAGSAAARGLVVTEGLLVYLPAESVAELASDLAAQPGFRWWLIDLASPRVLKLMERTWGKTLAAGNAPMLFAPEAGTAFFEPHGWREAEYRSIWEESLRLGRTMKLARLWNALARLYPQKARERFRRMSGVVLLERNG